MAQAPVHFMHLADLHLTPCPRTGSCGPDDPACDSCIKAKILEGLGGRFEHPRTRPDLVLLAGDLTDLWEGYHGPKGLRKAAEPLTRFVEKARSHGVVVAGVTGEHDGDGSPRAGSSAAWTGRSPQPLRRGQHATSDASSERDGFMDRVGREDVE